MQIVRERPVDVTDLHVRVGRDEHQLSYVILFEEVLLCAGDFVESVRQDTTGRTSSRSTYPMRFSNTSSSWNVQPKSDRSLR